VDYACTLIIEMELCAPEKAAILQCAAARLNIHRNVLHPPKYGTNLA
jgi:hypothetical protein